jgi:hypothetical protein
MAIHNLEIPERLKPGSPSLQKPRPLDSLPAHLAHVYWTACRCAVWASRLYVACAFDGPWPDGRWPDGPAHWVIEKLKDAIHDGRSVFVDLEKVLINARMATASDFAQVSFWGRAHGSAHAACLSIAERVLNEVWKEDRRIEAQCRCDEGWPQESDGPAGYPGPWESDPVEEFVPKDLEIGCYYEFSPQFREQVPMPDPSGLLAQVC